MMIDSKIELTHVLIPKQKGTHDSCVTTNEEQILEFQGMFLITVWNYYNGKKYPKLAVLWFFLERCRELSQTNI